MKKFSTYQFTHYINENKFFLVNLSKVSCYLLLTLFLISFTSCKSTQSKKSKSNSLINRLSKHQGKNGSIVKVKKFRARKGALASVEPMIPFEQSRILHGAVTPQEIDNRYGDYLTIIWKGNRGIPATIILEYTKQESGSRKFKKTKVVSNVRRKNVTEFAINGSEYISDGALASWRITVSQNGALTGSAASYLWK